MATTEDEPRVAAASLTLLACERKVKLKSTNMRMRKTCALFSSSPTLPCPLVP